MEALKRLTLSILNGYFCTEYVISILAIDDHVKTKIKRNMINAVDKFRCGEPSYNSNM